MMKGEKTNKGNIAADTVHPPEKLIKHVYTFNGRQLLPFRASGYCH